MNDEQSELPFDDDTTYEFSDFETPENRRNRHATARAICANPSGFKFCEACGNIYQRGGQSEVTGICIACHGYRFNTDPEEVKQQALRVCSRPRRSVFPADYH